MGHAAVLQILSIEMFINKCLHPRVECRLRVFENWVLSRIFGSERDGVTGEWRKLH